MKRFLMLGIALLGVLGSSSTSRADLVATFEGTIPSVNVSMTFGSQTYTSNPVGPFIYTVSPTSTDPNFAPNSTLRSFCGDLYKDVSPGNTYNYTVVDPSTLPSINGDASKLAQVELLFGRYYASATDATKGGAFQLALWAILYDTPGSTPLNLGSGNLTVTSPSTDPEVALANSWLATIGTPLASDSSNPSYKLLGLESSTAQNQLTVLPDPKPVPAPAGLVLGLIAVGGFVLRRKNKKS